MMVNITKMKDDYDDDDDDNDGDGDNFYAIVEVNGILLKLTYELKCISSRYPLTLLKKYINEEQSSRKNSSLYFFLTMNHHSIKQLKSV